MSKFRKAVALLLICVNTTYPVLATASTYFYRTPLPSLKSRTGAALPTTWVDPANTSATTATAGAAILRIAPSNVDFGKIAVTRSSPDQTLTLYNAGGQSLTLGALSVSSQFTVTAGCDGVVVPPLGSCQVNTTFTPTQVATGSVTGTLTVPFASNGQYAQAQANLSGLTQAPPAGAQAAGGLGGFTSPSGVGDVTPAPGDNVSQPESAIVGGVATIQFPQAIINQQSWGKSFVIASTGDSPLGFKGLTFQNNDGSFTASSDCPASIPVGQQCTVTATFAPKTIGSKVATLVVTTNGYTGNNTAVSLRGTALEVYPVFGATSTSSVDFATIIQGAADTARTVTISNSGTAALNLGTPTLSGQATGLTIASSTCATPVAPGNTCAITLIQSAAAVSVLNAKLDIPHDGRLTPSSPVHIPVTGSVVAQTRVLAYPASLDWDMPDVGTASTRTVTVTNTGNMPVSGITAAPTAPFTLTTNNCSAQPLQPNSSCTLTFSLTPTANGVISRAATITATNLTTPAAALNLTGSARTRTMAAPAPISYAFGLQSTQAWSNTEYVTTLTNSGNVTIHPVVAGRGTTDNIVASQPWIRVSSDTCAAGVAPGATCTIGFQVKPTSAAAMSGSVTLYPDVDTTTNAKSVSMTATGTLQNYSISATSLDYGTVGSLQYVDRVITVTNTSATNVSLTGFSGVTLVNPTAPASAATLSLASNTCSTGTVAPGATCAVTIRMTAKSYASATPVALTGGTATFYYSGARSSNQTVTLSGNLVGSVITTNTSNANFGDIPVGVAAASAARRVVTVANSGAYPVSFASYTLSTNANALSLVEDTSVANRCVAGASIPANGNCVISFYNNPTTQAFIGAVSRDVAVQVTSLAGTVTPASPVTFQGNNLAPTLSLSATSLDFGTVGEKTTATRTFTFQVSHGGAGYWINAPVTGTGYSFSVANCTANRDLATGTVCTATVQFTPGVYTSATVPGSIALNFYVGSTQTTLVTIPLTAQVEKSAYVIDANDLAWGNVASQTAGNLRYAVIRNASASAAMPLTGVRTVAAPFTISTAATAYTYKSASVANCVGLAQLTAGQSCYVGVSLSGVTGATAGSGAFSGNTIFATGTAEGSISVPMTANFMVATPTLSATQVAFPNPTQSTTSHNPDLTVSVTNSGGGRLYWTTNPSQSYQFQTTGDFWLVRQNNTTAQALASTTVANSTRCEEMLYLEGGASCSLTVRFTPTGSAGTKSGVLTLSSLTPTLRTQTVSLSGTAQAGVVYMNQDNVDFGRQLVASTTTRSLVIGNGGDGSMGIRNIVRLRADGTSPAYASEMTVVHNCPASLASGAECLVNVTFAPDRNLNWGTLAIKEVVQYENYTNGAWSTVKVPLTGEGYGSTLTASQLSHDLGAVEATKVAQDYASTVTFTASGQAPVRINSAAPATLTYLATVASGTCTSGLVLSPGDSCTQVLTNRVDFTGYALGTVKDTPQQVMTINGSFLKADGSVQSDQTVTLLATAKVVSPTTLVEVNPRVVTSRFATPTSVFGTDLRAGAQLTLDGSPMSSTWASPTELRFTLPSGLTTGSHTIGARNTDGRNILASTTFSVADIALDTNVAADVHTVAYDRPFEMRTAPAGVGNVVALDDGRTIYADKAGFVRMYDNAGHLMASAAVGATSTIGALRATAVGSELTVGWVSGTAVNTSCVYSTGYCTYAGTVSVGTQTFTIGSTGLTAGASSNVLQWSANTSGMPYLTVTGMDIARSGNQTLMAYSYSVATVGASNGVRVWSGASSGSAYALTAHTGNNAAVGTSLVNNVAYVRYGDRITTYQVSGTALTAGTSYQYGGALNGAGSGLAFNTGTAELLASCYSDRAVCVIPTAGDALGSAALLTGSTSTNGYVDGAYSSAQFNIAYVGPNSSGAVVYQNATPNATRVVNVRNSQQRPTLTTSQSKLEFGQIKVGDSAKLPILIGNSGTQNLAFQNVTTAGIYTATHNCPSELAPGASCVVEVTATPTSPDTFTGTLAILTNSAASSSTAIALTAVGGASRASMSSTASIVGTYNSGANASTAVQVTNSGTTNMTLTGVTGLTAPMTLLSNTCSDIAPTATCALTFSNPTTTMGTTSSTVTTVGANVNASATVTASTTGVIARWSTTAMKFNAGSTYSQTISLFNDGNATARFTSVSGISAPFSADMSACTSVAPAGSCVVTISYAPSSAIAVTQSGVTPVGGNESTNTLSLVADSTAAIASVAGSKALVGIAGATAVAGAVGDDTSVAVAVSPSVPIKFFNTTYSTLYVGSNSYITFGAGSNSYSGQTLSNPPLPGIVFGGADNSFQRVYTTNGTLNGIAFQRVRYEGTAGTSGTAGSPNILVEVTFFAPSATEQYVEVNVGVHVQTSGVFGVKNSSTTGTVSGGTITANTTYVFKSDPAGNNWTITKGAHIQ